ncbi:virulence factor SrfB [Leclercia adecarboxylata]|uniref:virulence factor SrfB n=1 Tax=Leclercia adecarboxylata TaxID=83655 RepID=UPI0022393A40|nr:virulence factor SrfB [Leclercia adecarboxylata]
MNHASTPRRLRNVIMTVPPAMPKPERAILSNACSMHPSRVEGVGWEEMDDESEETNS